MTPDTRLTGADLWTTLWGRVALQFGGNSWTWVLSRAGGLVAFALLSFSFGVGLLARTGWARRRGRTGWMVVAHQWSALLVLAFAWLHAGVLLKDGFVPFRIDQILLPGRAPYAPFWVALGSAGIWVLAYVLVTFQLRRRLGERFWKSVHAFNPALFVALLTHGLVLGPDTHAFLGGVIYAASLGWVLFALGVYGRERATYRAQRTATAASERARRTNKMPA